MTDIDQSTLETNRMRKSSLLCGTPQEVLRQVPFQYTHNHLRDWGYAYLGNIDTADAFVNAMNLRRTSLELSKEELHAKSTDLVTIRARVLPMSKERKPFLLQRQFNINELRSSIPKAQLSPDVEGDDTPTRPRRSSRIRRSSAWQAERKRTGQCSTSIAERPVLSNGALPIRKLL